ncbi:D-2-hydroxyacid dehydrogenase family protein [Pusillimonas sp. SM2304]|uniref:D-2-hydroxyacid dehydrogenase family protein n=1 Tax=Pusillimonas sp. SM2304 TaxID=3073241 RepID=UPI002876F7B2|nr:D-2-hydroxyacid dehydrogenase family protein [Pusillimonas sp. SM2304]MDS1139594.1 D-2-hydroxyacid dehydrogenase family protein [Pusillimonas sp. SM2304]
MHIVIADDYQRCVRELECFSLLAGHDITVYETAAKDKAELIKRLSAAEILVVVRERITLDEEVIAALPRLQHIALVGRHTKTIDFEACTRHGIVVTNGVFASPIAPAELTMALILASRRNVVLEANRMRAGEWPSTFSYRLDGSTLGIYGLGVIGERVARACAALGMNILVWGGEGSQTRAKAAGYEIAESRESFFKRADVLSIHLRYGPSTKGAVKLDDLRLMKPSSLFVNTARAELIEPDALVTALREGRPGSAAVDVYEVEPVLNGDHPLLKMDNVICMPHLGWADKETFELYYGEAFEQVRNFATDGPLRIVNKDVTRRAVSAKK